MDGLFRYGLIYIMINGNSVMVKLSCADFTKLDVSIISFYKIFDLSTS